MAFHLVFHIYSINISSVIYYFQLLAKEKEKNRQLQVALENKDNLIANLEKRISALTKVPRLPDII